MSSSSTSKIPHTEQECRDMLAQSLLQLAGMSYPRMGAAKKIARALDRALPGMPPEYQAEARARIRQLETRWGPLLEDAGEINCTAPENDWEIAPEKMIGQWLARRHVPERLLEVLYRAAKSIWGGEKYLSEIMDYAYANETDQVVHPVGYDSFREWMIELRIGEPHRNKHRVEWRPGALCHRWKDKSDPLYALSMEELNRRRVRQPNL